MQELLGEKKLSDDLMAVVVSYFHNGGRSSAEARHCLPKFTTVTDHFLYAPDSVL